MSNTPSETEIDSLLCKHWPAYSMQAVLVKMWLRDAMRAALAKWGTPAPVGVEPIGYLYCGGSYGDELADWEIVADQRQCDKLNEHHGALGKEAKLPIYTTPQPTQTLQPAEREPLTDAQIKGLIEEGVFFGNCKEIVRAIEAAHGIGIKGDRHGAE